MNTNMIIVAILVLRFLVKILRDIENPKSHTLFFGVICTSELLKSMKNESIIEDNCFEYSKNSPQHLTAYPMPFCPRSTS